jgi:hypothetical protein
MKSVRFLLVEFIVAVFFLSASSVAHSQQRLLEPYNPANFSQTTGNSYLNLMVGLRKYFNSFTSWQFPNFQGPQDPLSRLEYPWDQTFLAIRGTATYTGLEVNMEWSGTLSVVSNSKAQDSDWQDPNDPNQKTTFAEAEATPRCWIVDLSCNMQVPGLAFLKGVAGFRNSQFKFTNTDVYQYSIYDEETNTYVISSVFLPGPNIEFSQYYKHLYGGGILDASFNFPEISNGLRIPPLLLRIQADASYVMGKNHDEHLLRGYNLQSTVDSSGLGWHVNIMTGFRTGRLKFDIEGDMRGVSTTGQMLDMNGDPAGPYAKHIDGAKAWSEQKYLGINGTIFF